MSYKVCTRCEFVVDEKKKICSTCGGRKFHGAIPQNKRQRAAHTRAVIASARPVKSQGEETQILPSVFATTSSTGRSPASSGDQSHIIAEANTTGPTEIDTFWWQAAWTKLKRAFSS